MATIEKYVRIPLDELLRSIEIECEKCKTKVMIGQPPKEKYEKDSDVVLQCPRCTTLVKGEDTPTTIVRAGDVVGRLYALLKDEQFLGRITVRVHLETDDRRFSV